MPRKGARAERRAALWYRLRGYRILGRNAWVAGYERDLPERERTRHMHRLHPYLGKFIPQLVEVLLSRYFRPGQHILDPFAGSGTTLVQALESGLDATGVDVAAFNCLLMNVKTQAYNPFVLEQELRAAHARVGKTSTERPASYVRRWYAPQAARELLGFRAL